MISNNFFTIKNIAAMGILTALVVVFQFIANYISFGPVNINLSLTIIVIGAMIYGPFAGAFLGFVSGAIVLLAPSTMAIFFPTSILGTILVCLLKTSIAGFLAGLIFKILNSRNHNLLGSIIASLIVPIVNTALFGVGFLLFFYPLANGENAFITLITTYIGFNFFIELTVNVLMSNVSYRIFLYYKNR